MNMCAWESMSLWVLMRIWEGRGAGGVCVCFAVAGGLMMQCAGITVMKQHEGRDYSN